MNIKERIRENKEGEILKKIDSLICSLHDEGLDVEFGAIGYKTTYALIYSADHKIEYVGYTFIKDLKYYNENTGKLKALEQAIARKETLIK